MEVSDGVPLRHFNFSIKKYYELPESFSAICAYVSVP